MADRYLVTGGAGFIGSNMVIALLEGGHAVRVLDNFSTGRRTNLANVADDVELLEGDIRSYERCHNAVRDQDYVIHLAALPSVPRSVQDPLTTHAVNSTGALNVLLAARDAGVRRVVLASSSSVYGANHRLPKHTDMLPVPISPYGVSKLAAERYAGAFHDVYGLETVSLRYFNIFGPRQDPDSQYSAVIPKFILSGLAGREVVVYGDGEQTRDFTFVSNAVDMTLAGCTAEGISGRTLNVACGEQTSLNRVAEQIGRLVGRPLDIRREPGREGDVRHSWASVDDTIAALGVTPAVRLSEGLALTVEHFRGVASEQRAS